MIKFETCHIELKVRGGEHYVQYHDGITPAEFVILQELHGATSVRFVEKQGFSIEKRLSETGEWQQRFTPAYALLEKLRLKYGEDRVSRCFKGENPILPATFEDIKIDSVEDIEKQDDSGWEALSGPVEVEEPKQEAETPKKTSKKAGGRKAGSKNKKEDQTETPEEEEEETADNKEGEEDDLVGDNKKAS